MPQLLRRRWEPEFAGIDVPRRDRLPCSYDAYVPDGLQDREFVFEGPVAADVVDAERAVSALDHHAVALGDTEALARLLLRAESVASSRIEGLEVGPRRLLQADAARVNGASSTDVTATDVLANIDAMAYALETTDVGSVITVDQLLEVHRRLLFGTRLAEHAGTIRTQQNWIGGGIYNPCSASYVPPPPELVPELLDDLCRFCNTDGLPAIAQAAIAHAQFETIHPFVDGNGRVGRALIHMILRRRGLTARVTPPVSLVLATRAQEYVNALISTRYAPGTSPSGAARAVSRWVELFAASTVRAARDAEAFEDRIRAIVSAWYERLGPVRSHSTIRAIIAVLPGAPVVTTKTAAQLTGRSIPAVNAAIARLVGVGILHEANNRAWGRIFEAREIVDAFTDLERQLASPAGDTRVELPVRTVPRRTRTAPRKQRAASALDAELSGRPE